MSIDVGTQGELIRRNIHTYPFKYSYSEPGEYFAPDQAAIYVHIPFCSTKCHFCDYVVTVGSSMDLREAYVRALCNEIRSFPLNPAFPAFTIDAVYFGGGTPGLLTAPQLIRILEACRQTFPTVDRPEVGIECDPVCVELEKLEQLREAGFNRLSVGVQSFDDRILEETNRPHRAKDVYQALEVIARSGFSHTNIDLLYPLLNLTVEIWEQSVRSCIELEPACITAYPLEIWPDTVYYKWLTKRGHKLPPPEDERAMAGIAFDFLEAAGYRMASSSGYFHPSRAPRYCRFLDYYWRTWPMIGFGVGSKSVIHDRLYTNITKIRDYIDCTGSGKPVLDFSTRLTKRQEMHRVVIRGLKVGTVSKPAFYDRFGVDLRTIFGKKVDELVATGLLQEDEDEISITRQGQIYSNNVYEAFYTEDDLREPRPGEVQFGISELILS